MSLTDGTAYAGGVPDLHRAPGPTGPLPLLIEVTPNQRPADIRATNHMAGQRPLRQVATAAAVTAQQLLKSKAATAKPHLSVGDLSLLEKLKASKIGKQKLH